jgi:hypothetical protein
MPKSQHGEPKLKRHFTITDTANAHLSSIAAMAHLSRSEALERLIRSTAAWEGEALLANGAWELCVDHTDPDSKSPWELLDPDETI